MRGDPTSFLVPKRKHPKPHNSTRKDSHAPEHRHPGTVNTAEPSQAPEAALPSLLGQLSLWIRAGARVDHRTEPQRLHSASRPRCWPLTSPLTCFQSLPCFLSVSISLSSCTLMSLPARSSQGSLGLRLGLHASGSPSHGFSLSLSLFQ